MGRAVLQGICTAMLTTVLTLVVGILWSSTGLGVVTVSQIVDIGLLASCLIGGYQTGKQTSNWILGSVVGAGFVAIGSLLLSLFTPIRGMGFLQVLIIGALLGAVAGAFGAGSLNRKASFSSGTKKSFAYNTWSKADDWQTEGEEKWISVDNQTAQVLNNSGINELKSVREDNGFEGGDLSVGSFEESVFFKGDEVAKRPLSQTSSPWWEEEHKIIHNL